jgi:limonene 1,2-monooxygenase
VAQSDLRFGIFFPPYHKFGLSPTHSLHRSLGLIELWDRLGFDEVWLGEHHSGATEVICSPEQFLTAAAMRTQRIKLGTGVVSVPYHHPFMVAQRLVLLDHMSWGRAMLGVGPGALPMDASMLGIEQSETRPRLEQGLEAIVALVRGREPVTMETDWFTLHEAQLQIRPYRRDLEIAVAAAVSPSGPKLAGRFGCGMLEVAATSEAGFKVLMSHWEIANELAELNGHTFSRDGWRLAGPMHLADTREQAYRDVEYGILDWATYFQQVGAVPSVKPEGKTVRALIDEINDSGLGVIGTPDEAIAQVQRLIDQSGGFGAYLILTHDWADPDATNHSFELFARHVMPEFQGALEPLRRSRAASAARFAELSGAQSAALDAATQRFESERAQRASGLAPD